MTDHDTFLWHLRHSDSWSFQSHSWSVTDPEVRAALKTLALAYPDTPVLYDPQKAFEVKHRSGYGYGPCLGIEQDRGRAFTLQDLQDTAAEVYEKTKNVPADPPSPFRMNPMSTIQPNLRPEVIRIRPDDEVEATPPQDPRADTTLLGETYELQALNAKYAVFAFEDVALRISRQRWERMGRPVTLKPGSPKADLGWKTDFKKGRQKDVVEDYELRQRQAAQINAAHGSPTVAADSPPLDKHDNPEHSGEHSQTA